MKINKRQEAINKGQDYFVLDVRCRNGHRSKRSVYSGECLECRSEGKYTTTFKEALDDVHNHHVNHNGYGY